MQVETAARVMRADPEQALAVLAAVLDQTDQAATVRPEASRTPNVRPTLDSLGLVSALQAHLDQVTSMPAALTVPNPLPQLPAAVETAAYRITRRPCTTSSSTPRAHSCAVRIDHDGAPAAN